jgi:fatty-acyl-CoA synthase
MRRTAVHLPRVQACWNQPEDTGAGIRDGLFPTGDLAAVDEDGYIPTVDRARDTILDGGEKVSSAEIERLIYGHPAVLERAVITVPDATWMIPQV